VHDEMLDGGAVRVLGVIDQWSRENVSLEVNFRLSGRCIGKALDADGCRCGRPVRRWERLPICTSTCCAAASSIAVAGS